MRDEAQVSATIATTTKERLDRFTVQLGLKKNFVVEQALLYYMEARRELPDEAFIPTRIETSPASDTAARTTQPPIPRRTSAGRSASGAGVTADEAGAASTEGRTNSGENVRVSTRTSSWTSPR